MRVFEKSTHRQSVAGMESNDRKIVDFERVCTESCETRGIDADVLSELVKSDDIGAYDQSD